MERDPVCGMEVDPAEADVQTVFEGRSYYFCSEECLSEFEREPQKYVREQGAA